MKFQKISLNVVNTLLYIVALRSHIKVVAPSRVEKSFTIRMVEMVFMMTITNAGICYDLL